MIKSGYEHLKIDLIAYLRMLLMLFYDIQGRCLVFEIAIARIVNSGSLFII